MSLPRPNPNTRTSAVPEYPEENNKTQRIVVGVVLFVLCAIAGTFTFLNQQSVKQPLVKQNQMEKTIPAPVTVQLKTLTDMERFKVKETAELTAREKAQAAAESGKIKAADDGKPDSTQELALREVIIPKAIALAYDQEFKKSNAGADFEPDPEVQKAAMDGYKAGFEEGYRNYRLKIFLLSQEAATKAKQQGENLPQSRGK